MFANSRLFRQVLPVFAVLMAALLLVQVAAAQGEAKRELFQLTGVVEASGPTHLVVNGQTIYFTAIDLRNPGALLGQAVYVAGFIGADGNYYATRLLVMDTKGEPRVTGSAALGR